MKNSALTIGNIFYIININGGRNYALTIVNGGRNLVNGGRNSQRKEKKRKVYRESI